MASKRRIRRKCQGKNAYSNQPDAVAHAIRLNKQSPTGEIRTSYKCGMCGKWHVGRKPRVIRDMIEKKKRLR